MPLSVHLAAVGLTGRPTGLRGRRLSLGAATVRRTSSWRIGPDSLSQSRVTVRVVADTGAARAASADSVTPVTGGGDSESDPGRNRDGPGSKAAPGGPYPAGGG